MRIGICDDETIISDELTRLCNKYMEHSLIKFDIIRFSSGEELLQYQEPIDILFLDIQMKRINGMRAAMKLREKDDSVSIIFVTAYHNFMLEGYRVRAFRYLLKPVSEEQFMKTLDEAVKDLNRDSKTILMKDGSLMCIKLRNIIYIEYGNHRSLIRTKTSSYDSELSMRQWESILNTGDFYRVHKSYIVNMGCVEKIDNIITLDNGEKVDVSDRKRVKFKAALLEYRRLNSR